MFCVLVREIGSCKGRKPLGIICIIDPRPFFQTRYLTASLLQSLVERDWGFLGILGRQRWDLIYCYFVFPLAWWWGGGGNTNLEKLRSRKKGQASAWVCIFAELFGEGETVRESLKNRVEIIFVCVCFKNKVKSAGRD